MEEPDHYSIFCHKSAGGAKLGSGPSAPTKAISSCGALRTPDLLQLSSQQGSFSAAVGALSLSSGERYSKPSQTSSRCADLSSSFRNSGARKRLRRGGGGRPSDENGSGPGVRLRKSPKAKREAGRCLRNEPNFLKPQPLRFESFRKLAARKRASLKVVQ
jgi:hypothetical protein